MSVCVLRNKEGIKNVERISQQFFILQAKFSLAQVATKNKIFLMNRSTKEKGSSETLNCFHSSLNFGQWMAKLKHLGALPINLVFCSGENCTLISNEEAVIPLGYTGTSVADPDPIFNCDADPDPPFHCDADPYSVIQICNHRSTDLLRLHCESLRPSVAAF
jgi:hypothetical protein